MIAATIKDVTLMFVFDADFNIVRQAIVDLDFK